MSDYRILTDSGSDLPKSMVAALNLSVSPLYVTLGNTTSPDSVDEGIEKLYADLRSGVTASTSAINPQQWASAMEAVLADGLDALVLTFSSGLSTTYQSAVIAANELAEKYPQRKIRVVDTLSASLGQGLLVWYACRKQNEGMGLDELANWVSEHRLQLCHWFTVDDLMYLKRGGRVSAATALVGTMLNIKPVLHVDDEGRLISKAKVRGRKASIAALAAKMGQLALPGENDTVFICHGDCSKDAALLADMVRENYGVREVVIGYTGAVIGSHSGPGTLALFFLGEHR